MYGVDLRAASLESSHYMENEVIRVYVTDEKIS